MTQNRQRHALPASHGAGDHLLTVLTWGMALLVTGMFVWLLADILVAGVQRLDWEFLTTAPRRSGREGGILPIIVSTVLILMVTLAASLPLGLGTAVFLSEYTAREGRVARLLRVSLDLLAGIPSIVFGLFGNAVFCNLLGMGLSILSGGLTLACMALPILIRTTEASLRDVPASYRQGAAALGLSQTTTLLRIVLPAAMPGLLAGLVLGIGRAIAETAALIFTSGYVDRMPDSLLDSGRALALHIYDLSMNVPGGNASAYGAAFVLILTYLSLNEAADFLLWRLRRRLGHHA